MKIRFLHLNIFMGKYLDNILQFVKEQNPDIINFQEVAGGNISKYKGDCFKIIKSQLDYEGELLQSWGAQDDPNAYFGNATFYKQSFSLKGKRAMPILEYRKLLNYEGKLKDEPRSILSLLLEKDNKQIQIINTHLAWGPTPKDEPYKLEQGRVLHDFMKQVSGPFILSGDFNLTSGSQVVTWISSLGRNLTTEHNISNTLNPRTHYAEKLFPKGIAVDYIFTSKNLTVENFRVIDNVDLSDHLGLLLEVDL